MAFSTPVLTTQLYNPNLENIAPQDLLRRAFAGPFSFDAAQKLCGAPQLVFTTASTATSDTTTINIASAVTVPPRTVSDDTASPTNQVTNTLANPDFLTPNFGRVIKVRVSTIEGANKTITEIVSVIKFAATPVIVGTNVVTGALNSTQTATVTAGAGAVNINLANGVTSTAVTWLVEVFIGDIR